jgi:ankyrin repeat protein
MIERKLVNLPRRVLEIGTHTEHLWATPSSSSERTPIQLASEMTQLNAVKLLFEFGAELNAPPAIRRGRTALQAAASAAIPDIELVEFLIEKGANWGSRCHSSGSNLGPYQHCLAPHRERR